MRRHTPLRPPTKGMRPHAQGLRPHGLGIYVVICHFTFKKVFRIPHTTIPNLSRRKVVRRDTPSACPPAPKASCPHAQSLRSHGLGIYVVICHFTFKKVFRITSYYNSQPPGSKVMSRLAPSCPPAQGSRPCAQSLHPHALGIYVVICHVTFEKVFRIPHTTIPNPQEARL